MLKYLDIRIDNVKCAFFHVPYLSSGEVYRPSLPPGITEKVSNVLEDDNWARPFYVRRLQAGRKIRNRPTVGCTK